ncbi:MAG: hypothetical protein ACK5LV_03875 [Lachnospirales bacterium]
MFSNRIKRTFKYTVILSCLITFLLFIVLLILKGFLYSTTITIVTCIPIFVWIFVLVYFMLGNKDRTGNKKNLQPKPEMTEFDFKIRSTKENLVKIKAKSKKINNPELSSKVDKFIVSTAKVIELAEEDDLDGLNNLFEYCVPTVYELVSEYYKFVDLNIESDEVTYFKEKVVTSIDEITDIIENLKDACIKRRNKDSYVDIKTVKTVMEYDTLDMDIDGDKK